MATLYLMPVLKDIHKNKSVQEGTILDENN
jgi:hypothetical protein